VLETNTILTHLANNKHAAFNEVHHNIFKLWK